MVYVVYMAKTGELRNVKVSLTNMAWLANMGKAGESYNDVLDMIRKGELKIEKERAEARKEA